MFPSGFVVPCPPQGSPHSGLDDAVNIARVVSRLVADGAVLKVIQRLASLLLTSPPHLTLSLHLTSPPHPSPHSQVNERLSPVPLEEGEGGRPRQLPYVTSVSK